ncbi:unnamed protein product, partial [Didymodactylos carnosus]
MLWSATSAFVIAWNHHENRCDWLDNVDCLRQETTETPSSNEGDEFDSNDDNPTSQDEESDKLPSKKKVTKKAGKLGKKAKSEPPPDDEQDDQELFECPQGTGWDEKTSSCKWIDDVNCEAKKLDYSTTSELHIVIIKDYVVGSTTLKKKSDSESTINSITPSGIAKGGDQTVECQPVGSYNIPDPNECNAYYQCENGHRTKLSCPEKQLFDIEKQGCDLFSKVFCGTRSVNLADKNQCNGRRDGIFPDTERECRVFFQCVGQVKAREASCHNNQKFNIYTNKCDQPQNVPPPCGNYLPGHASLQSKSSTIIKMLWLIYGSSGWIGGQCHSILNIAGQKVIAGRRITTLKDVEEDIKLHKPDRVICTLGRTHGEDVPNIDYLEKPGKLKDNIRDNLLAPMFIAQATIQHSNLLSPIPMLYIGTGCIYEYEDSNDLSHPFTESDPPNFFGSSYSTVKGATDLLLNAFPHVINARIRMPVSDEPNPRDFISKILGYRKITSLPNSMTVMSDILPILLAITHDGRFSGCINACNKGFVDHEWILKTYSEKTGEQLNYVLEPMNEQSARLAAKRSNNVLSTEKFEQWIKMISLEARNLYYAPHTLPDLEKSIENICIHRALKTVSKDSNDSRNLLVTGGCGFIGSNFINHWLNTYPEDNIINVDKLDTCSNIKNIEHSDSSRYKLVVASINNKDLMLHLMKQYEITHVVHFAAQTHVDTSFGNSILFTESNIFGTHCILEAARIYGKLRKFIHISTDEVYGEWPA